MFQQQEKTKKILKWLLMVVAIFFILGGIAASLLLYVNHHFEEKIYPGVTVNNIDLGGEKIEEARKILTQKTDKVARKGITFQYQNSRINVTPAITSFNPDLAYNIYSYNIRDTLQQAYKVGRTGNWWQTLQTKINTYLYGNNISIDYSVKKKEVKKILEQNFDQYNSPGKDASLIADITSQNQWDLVEFRIARASAGKILDYDQAVREMEKRLASLNTGKPVKLSLINQEPDIRRQDCQGVLDQADNIMKRSPWELRYPENVEINKEATPPKWTIDNKKMAQWLSIEKENEKIGISLNKDKVEAYLTKTISSKVNKEPINAKIEIKNGKVEEFRDSRPGRKLNINKTIAAMEKQFLENKEKNIE